LAPRQTPRHRETQLAFEALSIEGGLLSPEWLAKVAQLRAQHQSETDYRILKGLNLRDEIGRYWRIAQAHWIEFQRGTKFCVDGQALSERLVLGLLRDSFGFGSLAETAPVEIAGRVYPIGACALDGTGDVGLLIPPFFISALYFQSVLAAAFIDFVME